MAQMKQQLKHLNCQGAVNAEICQLAAMFFSILDSNEGESFQLIYDDLPIYYVPESVKQRAYIFANLFTKYHVSDRLAFPLLLRGLEDTKNWTTLRRAELKDEITPDLTNPEVSLTYFNVAIEIFLKSAQLSTYIYSAN